MSASASLTGIINFDARCEHWFTAYDRHGHAHSGAICSVDPRAVGNCPNDTRARNCSTFNYDAILRLANAVGRDQACTNGAAARHGRGTAGERGYPSVARRRASVNVLPVPSALVTVSSPPMPRAKSRLIARPSPVPSCGRVRSERTCTNGSKMRSC